MLGQKGKWLRSGPVALLISVCEVKYGMDLAIEAAIDPEYHITTIRGEHRVHVIVVFGGSKPRGEYLGSCLRWRCTEVVEFHSISTRHYCQANGG